jgi:hypothetical protein
MIHKDYTVLYKIVYDHPIEFHEGIMLYQLDMFGLHLLMRML